MKDAILIIIALVGIFLLLPFLILWIRDKVLNRPLTPEEIKAEAYRYEKRLLSPDLEALEKHFDCTLPYPLRKLYGTSNELALVDIEIFPPDGSAPIYICFYKPADADNLHSTWPGCEKYFAFADDGLGNELLVDPRLDDPPVLCHDHETDEIETVAASMSEFMKWKRQPVGGDTGLLGIQGHPVVPKWSSDGDMNRSNQKVKKQKKYKGSSNNRT